MDASAALVEAENILASATDERAQELGQYGAEHGFYMRTLLCPTMLRARGPFSWRRADTENAPCRDMATSLHDKSYQQDSMLLST